jgi:enamine deaminase RidA (YjgF/YER057c/UK114 family)
MTFKTIHPADWKRASGYSNGILVPPGHQLLFLAGQIAWDQDQQLVGAADFVAQFNQALANVAALVREAGGQPEHIVRLTIFVTDKNAYLGDLRAIGAVYREHLGRHYPAMSLVQVADLLETGALVEIEATACLPA